MTDQSSSHKLAITCDLGGSLTKAIAQVYPSGIPELMTMSPQVADVEKESVTGISVDRNAVDSAWVGIAGEYYVLGSLSKTMFAGTASLRESKYRYALPKLASLLWQACRKFNFNEADAFIHLLLPPGEIKDAETLKKQFSTALKSGIITPSRKLKVKLRNFYVSAEGSGILSYRRASLGELYAQKKIGILMLGYRNASFTLIEKGGQTQAESNNLGMSWVVQRFTQLTAVGLSKDDPLLLEALVAASGGNLQALASLSRKSKHSEIAADLKLFVDSVSVVRREYSRALVRWIRNIAVLDEVLVCGGTGAFVHQELTEHFQKEGIPIVWNGGVHFPASLDTYKLGERICDVWIAHINYIKMVDLNLGYERKGPLHPDSNKSRT
ncbi:ParM/StbA family protein [Fischerella sp. PCC 9605]|uniref:ParM/StbA family protein n=1 Tax=Fischerella sp. PCC 9605 TaxID=1173024 RepID=UPI00047CC5A7|nr:ParM/StbA family protein [Fischerella sp. PCC 9605]